MKAADTKNTFDSIRPVKGFGHHKSGAEAASDEPTPIDPSKSPIHLPADQYLHLGAPTEWWWHTGTLKAADRTFGFEINAASFGAEGFTLGFTEVMLTDVKQKTHFQKTLTVSDFNPNTWAEHDPSKKWFVKLGDVSMQAPQSDPTNMSVTAKLVDAKTKTVATFNLQLQQEGLPFIVWGTGVQPAPPPKPTLEKNNFYYSLTRLKASGSITIGDQKFDVTGVTWMDHEYGLFGTKTDRPKWILQDLQLDNGVCVSNYSVDPPKLGQKLKSFATVQRKDGTTYFVNSFVTPTEPWTSPDSHITYFMTLKVEIPAFEATIIVKSLVDSQEFPGVGSVYEGVASAKGKFEGKDVSGTAWNEQTMG